MFYLEINFCLFVLFPKRAAVSPAATSTRKRATNDLNGHNNDRKFDEFSSNLDDHDNADFNKQRNDDFNKHGNDDSNKHNNGDSDDHDNANCKLHDNIRKIRRLQ